MGAADAAGPQAPRSGVPVQSARWQTGQPGWTAAVADTPGTAELSMFDRSVASLQLQEAQRKHDLLVEHLHKDQEHKRRLVSPETAFTRTHRRLPDLHNRAVRCGSVKTETFKLPERVQGAHPAAEDDPEPTEGTQAADGASQEILRRLPRPAPCTPDEDAHQRREGEN